MMQVRIMRVLVHEPYVPVRVTVRLRGRIARLMFMLMVDVMHVPVLMLEQIMQVLMVVSLCEVQIDADPHEQRRADEGKGWRLAE